MKGKLPLIISIIALVVIGGGAMFLKKSSSKPQTSQMMTPAPTKQAMMGMMKDTLANLLNSGKSLQCTFSYAPTGVSTASNGTIMLSNGKMRGDFKVMAPGAPQTSVSMVRDSDFTYIWGSAMTTGIKFKNTAMPTGTSDMSKKYVDMNQTLNYKCDSWSADSSKFLPPADIKFQDMSSMMMSPSGTSGSSNAAACAACNSLSGDQKTTCLTQLKCY